MSTVTLDSFKLITTRMTTSVDSALIVALSKPIMLKCYADMVTLTNDTTSMDRWFTVITPGPNFRHERSVTVSKGQCVNYSP